MPDERLERLEKIEKLDPAIDRAVRGDARELLDRLERSSGLPGPKTNLELARTVGSGIARRGRGADQLVLSLARSDDEYQRVVAAMVFAARDLAGVDAKGALADLQLVAEDPRRVVREGIVAALRWVLESRGPAAVDVLAAWTDGYLQAHVALEALADRHVLDAIPTSEGVLARLEEAFALADESPRAAERTQGMRLLREGMPAQIATFAARFSEVIEWLRAKAAATRPETREVVGAAIAALRKRSLSVAATERLNAALAATAKPVRDPSRVVAGTRRRGKRRT